MHTQHRCFFRGAPLYFTLHVPHMAEVAEFRADLVNVDKAAGVSLQQLRQEFRAAQATLTQM